MRALSAWWRAWSWPYRLAMFVALPIRVAAVISEDGWLDGMRLAGWLYVAASAGRRVVLYRTATEGKAYSGTNYDWNGAVESIRRTVVKDRP